MPKAFISPTYTFTPGASGVGTVNLSGIASFDAKRLVAVINQTRGVTIYATGSTATRYTAISGTTLTLFVDTTGHNSGDVLQVIYDDPTALAVSGTVTANTGLSQPLTDTQLRAAAVPVSGPLTDTQLRATAVSVSGLFTDSPATPTVTEYSQTGVIAAGAIISLDCANARMVAVQTISVGTGGVLIAEWSTNNTNWVTALLLSTSTGASTSAPGTSSTASSLVSPVYHRYFRIRLSTGTSAGTTAINVATTPDCPFSASVQNVVLGTGGITGQAVATVGSDATSAAITSTTSSAAVTPASGLSYHVFVNISATSGTGQTLDIAIEESDDTAATWFKVYDFPRITGTGQYRSPRLPLSGNRVRYVQTVGGSAPSFTRTISRFQHNYAAPAVRQLIDRAVSLTTGDAATPSIQAQDCRSVQLVVNIGAATTAPALQIEGSDDRGASWYAIGSPLTAVASSTVQTTVADVNSQLVRARVSTAGSAVTAGYVLVKGFG
jgi:hypothetical protein